MEYIAELYPVSRCGRVGHCSQHWLFHTSPWFGDYLHYIGCDPVFCRWADRSFWLARCRGEDAHTHEDCWATSDIVWDLAGNAKIVRNLCNKTLGVAV